MMSSPRGSVSAKKSTIAKALGPRYLDDEQRGEAEKETKRKCPVSNRTSRRVGTSWKLNGKMFQVEKEGNSGQSVPIPGQTGSEQRSWNQRFQLCLLSRKTCTEYLKHQIITVLFFLIINFNTLEATLFTQPMMFYFDRPNCFHICPPVTR